MADQGGLRNSSARIALVDGRARLHAFVGKKQIRDLLTSSCLDPHKLESNHVQALADALARRVADWSAEALAMEADTLL
jgi:hypothetical protein